MLSHHIMPKPKPKRQQSALIKAIHEANLATPGTDMNDKYEDMIKHIQNNGTLTTREKDSARREVLYIKDRNNLLFTKGPTYKCNVCQKEGFTMQNCQHCIQKVLQDNWKSWTSGNDDIDQAIREAQLICPLPRYIIEWIPYEQFTNIKKFAEGGCASIFDATWPKASAVSMNHDLWNENGPNLVILKKLTNTHIPTEKFLNEVIINDC